MKNCRPVMTLSLFRYPCWLLLGCFVWMAATQAPAFGCANCATWWEQLLQGQEMIVQRINQLKQLKAQITQMKSEVRNGLTLDHFVDYENAFNTINEVHSLAWENQSVADNMQQASSNMEREYEDYSGLQTKGVTYSQLYQRWSDRNQRQIDQAWRVARLQNQSLNGQQDRMEYVSTQLRSAEGTTQVLQATGEIAQQQLLQLKQLNALLSAHIKFGADSRALEAEQQNAQAVEHTELFSTEEIEGMDLTGRGHKAGEEFKQIRTAPKP